MQTANIDTTELAALAAVIGAVALVSRKGAAQSQSPVINIPAGFGSGGDSDAPERSRGSDQTDSNDDPTSGDWQYEEPEDNPNSPQYEDPNLDFGDATPSNDSADYEFGGATGDNPTGTDSGSDGPTGGASPGDTTTGGTTPVGETGVSWDDVAGAGDHLAGSTDEWAGGLW